MGIRQSARVLPPLWVLLAIGCWGGGATPPGPPEIAGVASAPGQITLVWSPVAGASGYVVYVGAAPGVNRSSHRTGHRVPSSPYTITALEDGTDYYLAVTATSLAGEGPPSGEVRARTPPARPRVLVTAGSRAATLTWPPVRGATRYDVRGAGATYEGVASPFVVAHLTDGVPHVLSVTAVNEGGESPPAEVTTTPGAAGPHAPRVAPGDGCALVSWDPYPAMDAGTYQVYWGVSPNVNKDDYLAAPGGGTTSTGATHVAVTGLTNGTRYHFSVSARPAGLAQSRESPATAATPVAGAIAIQTLPADRIDETSLVVRGHLLATPGVETRYHFEWGSTPDLGEVEPEESTPDGGELLVERVLTGLVPGATYHVRVVATSDAAEAAGETVPVRTLAPALVRDIDGVGSLAIDDGFVYWKEIYGGGVVGRASRSGVGGAIAIDSGDVGGNSAWVSVSDGEVLWSGGTEIHRVDPEGGSPVTLAQGLREPSFLRRDGDRVYFRDDQFSIERVDRPDGQRATVHLEPGTSGICCLQVDETHVYWSAFGRIARAPKLAAGPPATLAVLAPSQISPLLLVDGWLYFNGALGIARVRTTGGEVAEIFPGQAALELATDGVDLFWVHRTGDGAHRVRHAPLGGGEVEEMAVRYLSGWSWMTDLVVDGDSVFWVENGNHYYPPMALVRRIPR